MKKFVLFTLVFLMLPTMSPAQSLERIIQSLPVFAAAADVKAQNGVLKVGIYSELQNEIPEDILSWFRDIKAWNHDAVVNVTGHQTVEVVSVNNDALPKFDGQILWVLAAGDSLPQVKKLSEKGIFTIGVQDKTYEKFLFVTLTYEDKSSGGDVERWRLVRLFANCDISPLRFTKKLTEKNHFVGFLCE